ncbi:hypothetical protein CAAN1_09S01376 [[Candida] anglica]|uniref:Survival protein SurE-like phosphatase/nucleotidase domain-containing protein n=1 Tax=[Candida] anglica TaxID=148631 RepID=A0ABP0EB58_9ASCO
MLRATFMLTTLLWLIVPTFALNILLTSTSSWGSTNVRHLQKTLQQHNHTVVLIAPELSSEISSGPVPAAGVKDAKKAFLDSLVQQPETSSKSIEIGARVLPQRAKNVVTRADVQAAAAAAAAAAMGAAPPKDTQTSTEDFATIEPVAINELFGNDANVQDCWYVNSTAATALLLAYDVILPKYYPDFVPDLVIVGPESGVFNTPSTPSHKRILGQAAHIREEMAQLSMVKNTPVITVSTADTEIIHSSVEELTKKDSMVAKNIEFVSTKVVELIDKLLQQQITNTFPASEGKLQRLLPSQLWLNVNFPSFQDSTQCSVSGSVPGSSSTANMPEFTQVSFDVLDPVSIVRLPKYQISESGDVVEVVGEYGININTHEVTHLNEPESETYIDTDSYYYMYRLKSYQKTPRNPHQDYSDNDDFKTLVRDNEMEIAVLSDCSISVVANNLETYGLDRNVWELVL